MNYSLGFTAGALLYKEAKEYISAISSIENYLSKNEIVANSIISTNSESSKKRIKGELDKRLQLLHQNYLQLFSNTSESDEKIILLLAICKRYIIITEFLLEVVYPKWKRFDYEITTYDFGYFLSQKLSSEKMDAISDLTKYKLSQVAIKMLKEVGILTQDKINQVTPSDELITLLNRQGDGWFLNCLLIN